MNNGDKEILRRLACRWMELASLPVMAVRKRQWTALKDLHAERPMVLFESGTLENYVNPVELECTDPMYRGIERQMRWTIRHAEEIGDDIVIEPFWRVYWDIDWPDYGVSMQPAHAIDGQGGNIAYVYEHSIQSPQDIDRLRPRQWHVDRAMTLTRQQWLAETFGAILPVVLHGTGSFLAAITQDLFKLIGNDNLLAWTYDEPDALHRMMAFLRDDRLAYYAWLESEGLLGLNNTGWELVGSGSPGYTNRLPASHYEGTPRLRDIWLWMESQETAMISPRMFGEFFLPYLAEVCRCFGLVYYGCCEPVHDRWDLVNQSIPNVHAVSISPWCNQQVMAQKLGRSRVYSRKPMAWPISRQNPDWIVLRQDLDETLQAARDCNLEIIYRDVYRIGERSCLHRWVEMVRAEIN